MAFHAATDPYYPNGFHQDSIIQYCGAEHIVEDIHRFNPFQQLEMAKKGKRCNSYLTDVTNPVVGFSDPYFTGDVVDKGCTLSEPAPVPIEFQQLHTVRKPSWRGTGGRDKSAGNWVYELEESPFGNYFRSSYPRSERPIRPIRVGRWNSSTAIRGVTAGDWARCCWPFGKSWERNEPSCRGS